MRIPIKVVLWGINYLPEVTGIAPFNAGLAEFLVDRGCRVEVLTTFPYYPAWRKLPGDRKKLFRSDDLGGVSIHRCWHYVPLRASTLRRMVHEISFGLSSFLRFLTFGRSDVVVVVSPPLLLGPLATLACWIRRRPFVFHVQDLQPDAAVGLGMVKPGLLTAVLYWVERFSYRHAQLVSGISPGMMAAFRLKGVPEGRLMLFPNWVRWYGDNRPLQLDSGERELRARAFRRKFGVPEGAFLAAYSGNLGRKQGLENLVAAAARLEGARQNCGGGAVHFLIVGDGAMRQELEAEVSRLRLRGVQMLPLLAEDDYLGLLLASDVSLILQAPGTGQFFFPSKLLSVLSAGCPVITAADDSSELAKAVAEGGFGLNVAPADPEALAAGILSLASDRVRLKSLREATKWVEKFSADVVLPAYESRLRGIVEAETRNPI